MPLIILFIALNLAAQTGVSAKPSTNCVKITQCRIKSMQECAKMTHFCVKTTRRCVKMTHGCVKTTHGCIKITQGCVKTMRGCVKITRGCVKSNRLCVEMMRARMMGEGGLTESRALVDSIGELPGAENFNYSKLMTVLLDLADSGKRVIEMDSAQVQTLQEVVSSNTNIAARAEVAVSAATYEQFEHPIVKIQDAPTNKMGGNNNEEEDEDEQEISNERQNNFNLYPNPNDGSMQLDYSFIGQSGKLLIYDIYGRIVAEYQLQGQTGSLVIREETLSSGMYYYQIIVDNVIAEKDKLLIIK